MTKYNLSVNHIFTTNSKESRDFFLKLLECKYSDDKGYGFTSISLRDSMVTGILLKTIKKYYHYWNSETSSLEREYYNVIKEIGFYIDLENSIFIVEGGIRDMNILKQVLRQDFYNEFTYSSFQFSPYVVLNQLTDINDLVRIEEISLVDFKAENIFLGKYTAKLTNPYISLSSLKIYENNISKIKICLKSQNDEFYLSIMHNNSFILDGTETDKCYLIDLLISKTFLHG